MITLIWKFNGHLELEKKISKKKFALNLIKIAWNDLTQHISLQIQLYLT